MGIFLLPYDVTQWYNNKNTVCEGWNMGQFVKFENVSKIYRMGEVEIKALHNASFSIEKGEICVIVGPSGAGKDRKSVV